MQKATSFNNVTIVYVKGNAYIIHFGIWAKMMQLTQRMVLIWLIKKVFYFFFMSDIADLTYYQRNRDVILNKAKDYYKIDKKRLREQSRNKYRHLSEEEKNKERKYGKNRYHNMPEEKKQRLKEHQKNITRQACLNIIMNKIVF